MPPAARLVSVAWRWPRPRGPVKNGVSTSSMPSCPRSAEAAHQIDQPVQVVGLECQDELIVAESEGGYRVGKHIRELAAHGTVLGQHLASFGRGKEIPPR
jgi:hypothetical protein